MLSYFKVVEMESMEGSGQQIGVEVYSYTECKYIWNAGILPAIIDLLLHTIIIICTSSNGWSDQSSVSANCSNKEYLCSHAMAKLQEYKYVTIPPVLRIYPQSHRSE